LPWFLHFNYKSRTYLSILTQKYYLNKYILKTRILVTVAYICLEL